ncbi:hypothetical protein KXX35_009507, partial [Aspergillus fumigatus]
MNVLGLASYAVPHVYSRGIAPHCQESPFRVIYQSHSLIAKNSLFRGRCALHRLLSSRQYTLVTRVSLRCSAIRCPPGSPNPLVSPTATVEWWLISATALVLALVLRRTISRITHSPALPAVPPTVGGPSRPLAGPSRYPNFAQKGENVESQ